MTTLLAPLLALADEAPQPEDVQAGWTAFVVLLLLIGAVVFLAFSLTKQLRKAEAAKEAGVFDDPADKPAEDPADERGSAPQ